MEPLFTDTRLIQTPVYNGQFRFSRRKKKTHILSLKLIRLMRTLRHVPSVSVLTGFHFFIIENVISLKNADI